METVVSILNEIERLTIEQSVLINDEDRFGLAENLAQKEALVQKLKAFSGSKPEGEALEILQRITALEEKNITAAQTEMSRLRGLLKKTQEGMTTVRGYDRLSANVGATYFDTKN